jgi:hypothetical protein
MYLASTACLDLSFPVADVEFHSRHRLFHVLPQIKVSVVERGLEIVVTEPVGSIGNYSGLYSGGIRFESRPAHAIYVNSRIQFTCGRSDKGNRRPLLIRPVFGICYT